MKKVLSLILALVLCLSLCACAPNEKKLTEILCSGGWSSIDNALDDKTLDRETRYTAIRFFGMGTCEIVYEEYKSGRLVSTSVMERNWKIEDGKIAIYPDFVVSHADAIYLQYADDTLNGSTWFDDQFTYKHISNDEITAIRNSIVSYSVGLEYVHNGDGTCTVVGMGTCDDKEIIIPAYFEDSEVTAIGKSAFGPWPITSIVFPDTITYIGESAFLACEALTYVTIGNGVTDIGELAFANCTALKTITIPDGVTSIGQGAFNGCSSLSSVTIPGSVTQIGGVAFCECRELYRINFEGTVAQWEAIEKDDSWYFKSGIRKISCTDGEVRYAAFG